MKVDDTVEPIMFSKNNPLRLPAHRRLPTVGDNNIIAQCFHANKSDVLQVVEVPFTWGGEKLIFSHFHREVPSCLPIECLIGTTCDAVIHYFSQTLWDNI